MDLSGFDATQVAPADDFGVIPPGEYLVQIIESEEKPTKDGGGSYLWLEHEILDGEFKGRKLWNNLNLNNANEKTVEIARRQLSAIAHAVDVLQPRQSADLHFKPLVAVVKVRPAGPDKQGIQRDAQNSISTYKPLDGSKPVVAVPASAQPVVATAQAKVPAFSGNAPWKAKKAS